MALDTNLTILNTIKEVCMIPKTDEDFDLALMIIANGVISRLGQLGVGPANGYQFMNRDAPWSDLLEDRTDLEMVKLYLAQKVRLMFDPPGNSFLVSAIEKQCDEYECEIQMLADPILEKEVDDEE